MATILVAEDERAIRLLTSLALRSAGHQVLEAANGLEAVALFRSYSSSIDLVITDMVMPVMDGYALVRIVQNDLPNARILCMSGFADQTCPLGATFLAKPFRPQQLLDTVDHLLNEPSR